MATFSIIALPLIVLSIVLYGYKKRVNIYDSFMKGVLEGLKTCLEIFPNILAMIFAVNLLIKSGFIDYISSFLNPILSKYNLSTDIISMSIFRPISGNASLAILNNILGKYGPDSIMGKLASTIQGSTDTTFYVLALYFGSIGVKKTRYALPVGLFADLVGILMSFLLVYLFFGR